MKYQKAVSITGSFYVGISILALVSVSLLSIINPQSTMDLVSVQLGNTDALSSIRGVYGGVGLSMVAGLIFLSFRRFNWALGFLTMFWGFYALSRLITILVDGPLGDFGNQWIVIESILFFLGLFLSVLSRVSGPALVPGI
jgi:nitrate reductase gamma subunit